GKLSGEVEDASAAPVDPPDGHAPRAQLLIISQDMGPTSRPSDADGGWMLAEDQDPPASLLLAQFVDQPALKLLNLVEVDHPEQVNLEGRRVEGRIHRDSIPRHPVRESPRALRHSPPTSLYYPGRGRDKWDRTAVGDGAHRGIGSSIFRRLRTPFLGETNADRAER